MRPSELKYHVQHSGENPYFFTRETMRFFGDTLKNYGVRRTTVVDHTGPIDVWELFRRRAVKYGLQNSAFFAVDGYRRVFPTRISNGE